MKVRVKWIGHMSLVAETGSGHSVVMDGPPDHGGRDLAARPMEMVLVGLGGCSTFDVVDILKKSRQSIQGCELEIEANRADLIPAVFTDIHLKFIITGSDLNETQVKRAVELSMEKYCSVVKMLRHSVSITHDFEIKNN